MNSFTSVQARLIAADFQKYVGLTTPEYKIQEVLVTPFDVNDRTKYLESYRANKNPKLSGTKFNVIVSVTRHGHNDIVDITVREFATTHNMGYSFPS